MSRGVLRSSSSTSGEFTRGCFNDFLKGKACIFYLNKFRVRPEATRSQESVDRKQISSATRSAIQWVADNLTLSRPIPDLQPFYMREAQRVWDKHEQPLDLHDPGTELRQERDGTWRVPDPKKEADLEQMRHRAMLKEFQQYLDTKGN